ncbi:alanine racemase [bacterium]|nr:alanine racemase [bacterium]
MKSFADIVRPTPLIHEDRARGNIAKMATKARKLGLQFRPHFKTHQSVAIGEWFRDEGVRSITVSSLGMAAYFVAAGWDDITVAFPFNPRESALAGELAGAIRLGLLVDGPETLAAVAALAAPVRVWIKIDTGFGRVGIPWDRGETVRSLAQTVNEKGLEFAGILTHNGASYFAENPEGVRASHAESLARMRAVAESIGDGAISVGDTPSCILSEDFRGVQEIRPGNFVFFDLMQQAMGVCREEEIAMVLACPVSAVYQDRVMLYGGAVHFSKDTIEMKGRRIYGCLADGIFGAIDKASSLIALSQEHGSLLPGPAAAKLRVGDLAWVYPAHSCLSADLHSHYRSFEGGFIPKWPGGR